MFRKTVQIKTRKGTASTAVWVSSSRARQDSGMGRGQTGTDRRCCGACAGYDRQDPQEVGAGPCLGQLFSQTEIS
jgi:hypothetical protein